MIMKMKGAVLASWGQCFCSLRNVLLANRKFVQEILDEVMIGLT